MSSHPQHQKVKLKVIVCVAATKLRLFPIWAEVAQLCSECGAFFFVIEYRKSSAITWSINTLRPVKSVLESNSLSTNPNKAVGAMAVAFKVHFSPYELTIDCFTMSAALGSPKKGERKREKRLLCGVCHTRGVASRKAPWHRDPS